MKKISIQELVFTLTSRRPGSTKLVRSHGLQAVKDEIERRLDTLEAGLSPMSSSLSNTMVGGLRNAIKGCNRKLGEKLLRQFGSTMLYSSGGWLGDLIDGEGS
jgi:hypothetical protein